MRRKKISVEIENEKTDERKAFEAVTRPKARVEAYGRIIARVKKSFVDYAATNPENAQDEAFESWIELTISDIAHVLEILDDYAIEYKKEEENGPDTISN